MNIGEFGEFGIFLTEKIVCVLVRACVHLDIVIMRFHSYQLQSSIDASVHIQELEYILVVS